MNGKRYSKTAHHFFRLLVLYGECLGITGSTTILDITVTANPIKSYPHSAKRLRHTKMTRGKSVMQLMQHFLSELFWKKQLWYSCITCRCFPESKHQAIFNTYAVPLGPVALSGWAARGYFRPCRSFTPSFKPLNNGANVSILMLCILQFAPAPLWKREGYSYHSESLWLCINIHRVSNCRSQAILKLITVPAAIWETRMSK